MEKKYMVIRTIEVEYYFNVKARNKKEAIEKARNRILEDNYQWLDEINIEVEEDNSIYVDDDKC